MVHFKTIIKPYFGKGLPHGNRGVPIAQKDTSLPSRYTLDIFTYSHFDENLGEGLFLKVLSGDVVSKLTMHVRFERSLW